MNREVTNAQFRDTLLILSVLEKGQGESMQVHAEEGVKMFILRCHQSVTQKPTFHFGFQELRSHLHQLFNQTHSSVSLEIKAILMQTVNRHNILSSLNWHKTDKFCSELK